MATLPIAFFFSASRSKNWSSLALSSAWGCAVVNASVSKLVNNILIFIKSEISEQWRKEHDDYRRPRAVDRQVIRLPFFERGERSAPSQEADVKHGRPHQIDQENHVLAQGRHAVRSKAELGNARSDGPQRYRVRQ